MDIKELQDQLVVLAAIQQKQSEIQKLQAGELDAVRARTLEMQKQSAALQRQLDIDRATRDERMQEWDQRIMKLVSGFGVFLAQVQRSQ
jgi:hypothetical protein